MTHQKPRLALACLIGASAVLAACSTTPADTTPVAAAEPAQAQATDDKYKSVATLTVDTGVRCKRVQKTGTHMYTKVCTTAAQRERMKQDALALASETKRVTGNARLNMQATRQVTGNVAR